MERRRRLREGADFRRVRASKRRWHARLLTLLVAPNALPHNRYGAIVSKRVGKAVTRNLVKRRLREVLRRLDREGRIAPGHDLAFIARQPVATAPFAEVREAILALLARAALLQPAAERREAEAASPGERDPAAERA